ncbi:MAG: HAD family hydrolase [Mycobacteriales bacterium]
MVWRPTVRDLYPVALPTLARLRQGGYHLAVMANQPREASPFLATLPVGLHATSAEWGVSKPDPRFFARLLAEVGAPPRRIAYVGDRVDNDVLPAKAAGVVTVHLRRGPWGLLHSDWPEAEEADLRLRGPESLPEALDALPR